MRGAHERRVCPLEGQCLYGGSSWKLLVLQAPCKWQCKNCSGKMRAVCKWQCANGPGRQETGRSSCCLSLGPECSRDAKSTRPAATWRLVTYFPFDLLFCFPAERLQAIAGTMSGARRPARASHTIKPKGPLHNPQTLKLNHTLCKIKFHAFKCPRLTFKPCVFASANSQVQGCKWHTASDCCSNVSRLERYGTEAQTDVIRIQHQCYEPLALLELLR